MRRMILAALFGVALTSMCVGVHAEERAFQWNVDAEHQYYTLVEGDEPVLRYNFGNVPVPAGVELKHFGDGRPYGGERSNYLHPVYGLNGEVITDDYTEHPHHRGIWLSWPVVRWKDRVADIWAVCDVWARPEKLDAVEADPKMALLKATNLWKFGVEEQHPIVREEMTLRVHPTTGAEKRGRMFDIDVTLTGLEDGVAIGGRPKAGYGGLTYRALPAENQEIAPFVAEESADPRGAWCRYSADFPGSRQRTSVVLIQHSSNPGYPTEHNVYAAINCFMPAFPGDAEYPLAKGKPMTLKHRVWIVEGVPSEEELQEAWEEYQGEE
jgi:methane monooxygenase PmoA-like